jgi:protein TonB
LNKFILSITALLIVATHLFAFAFFTKENKVVVSTPKYQKISMQFAQIKKTKVIKKDIKKKILKKQVIKKENKKIFKKPIKKDAKRKYVKKKHIKKRKVIKKKIENQVVKKEDIKKFVNKPILKAPIKDIKKESLKNTTQSMALYKKSKDDYLTKLRRTIDRNKKYPNASRRLKEEGIVFVSFRVIKSGLFTNIKIHKKSPKKRLNKAALKALLLTRKFDAFPKELKDKEFLDFRLGIRFKLK